MEEQLITLETAKLAKEKGFDLKTKYHYPNPSDKQDICSKIDWNNFIDMTGNSNYQTAPTQGLLQKWIREKHNIHIEIRLNKKAYKYQIQYIPLKNEYGECLNESKNFNTYEQALEEGLLEALKLIKL